MQIIEKAVDELIPYASNPRNNDNAVDQVAASIKEFGFKVPIVIDRDGVVVTGHTRLKAAKKLKMKTVPCIVADDLTPEQVKAFRLVDNRTSEFATWDLELLPFELSEIDLDLEPFGFQVPSMDDFGDDFQLPEGDKSPWRTMTLSLHEDQLAIIEDSIQKVYDADQVSETFGNTNHNGNGVYEVVRQWAEQKK